MSIRFIGTTRFNPTLFGELEDYGKKYNWKNQKKRIHPEPSMCQNQGDAQYHDHYLNGITYRVWSVFEEQTDAAKSLSNLMLRRLETGDEIGSVSDEFEEMIQRKNASAI